MVTMEYDNQVVVCGIVAVEPLGRLMNSGKPEYVMSVICRDHWTDLETGLARESTDRFHIVFYGRLGDQASEVLKAGMKVRVIGRLRTRDLKINHYVESEVTFIQALQFDIAAGDYGSAGPPRRFDSEFGPLRP